MAEKETENVSSTSVGSIKNVTSTPFVPRDHVSSAPLDGSIFEPAVPPSANSLCEMSSIAELSESSPAGTPVTQNIDTSNLDSEVSSSIKDLSTVGDEKSSTLDRGFCASSLADSNIASQSSSSPHSSSAPEPSSGSGQSELKETSEEGVKDEEKPIENKKVVEELVDVNEADKSVVEDSEEPLEVTESSKKRDAETGEKLLRVTEPSKEGMNKADQVVPESRVEDGDKKPLKVPESSNEGCKENQVSASTAQEEPSCTAAGQGMHSTAAAAGVEESMSVDGDLSASNSSSIYIEDKMVTTTKQVQTAPRRTRLTMAERATIEALASFGGAGLDSVLEPTETFRDKLEKDKQKLKESSAGGKREREDGKEETPTFKKTRLEMAVEESDKLFKDVPLGESTQDEQPQKAADQEAQPTTERRMTRLERARLEALKSFDGHGLHDVMSTSKRVISRTLEAKNKKLKEDKEMEEKENLMKSLPEGTSES